MGTALRNPGHVLSLLCDSASVLEGAVLVQGASNDTCALPSAANTRSRVLGLAYVAGSSSANGPMSLVTNGVWPGIAGGSITRGDVLVVAGTTGTVQSASLSTPVDASVVGVAMESVSSGERVAILIGARQRFSGVVLPMTASGAITANTIVIAGNGVAAAPGGANPTAPILGVALNTVADGATVYVCVSGYATVTDSGSGVTANARITAAGTSGLGSTAAPAGGTNCAIVGIALATTAASGSIPVFVAPSTVQG